MAHPWDFLDRPSFVNGVPVRPKVRSDVSAVRPAITGVRLSRDIRPLTEFRANAAGFIDQVRLTKKPDEVELLRDVLTAEEQIAARPMKIVWSPLAEDRLAQVISTPAGLSIGSTRAGS